MTKVMITRKDGHIQKVSARGHSDYAVEGEDIVCAALSSVMQTALLGLIQVAQIPMQYTSDEEEGILEFSLPPLSQEIRHDADVILETMTAGIADLYENFSKYIGLKIINS